MKKLPKLVSVVWQDAYSTDEWTDLDDMPKDPHLCRSVGWMVGRNKDFITVAGTISEDGQGCCMIHIPRGWIKEMKAL